MYTRIQFYPVTYLLKSLISRIFIFSEFLLRQFLRFRRQAAFVVIALGYPFDRSHLVTLICLQQQAALNFRYRIFRYSNFGGNSKKSFVLSFSILRSSIGKYTAIVTGVRRDIRNKFDRDFCFQWNGILLRSHFRSSSDSFLQRTADTVP